MSDLGGWSEGEFRHGTLLHAVLSKGSGPGVVLIPEIPGTTPEVLALGNRLVGSGFTVEIPSLVGEPGRPLSPGYAAASFGKVCISREFQAFALGAHRPVADYIRALAADLAGRTSGQGVGVIGLCWSGSFALAAAVEPAVLAPVLSQPSTPMPLTPSRRRDPGVSAPELRAIQARTRTDGLCLQGLRFSADKICPAERFATLHEALGDAFRVIEIDSSPGNPAGIRKSAHSVLASDYVDEPGHPTVAAMDSVLAFLHERLDSPVTAR